MTDEPEPSGFDEMLERQRQRRQQEAQAAQQREVDAVEVQRSIQQDRQAATEAARELIPQLAEALAHLRQFVPRRPITQGRNRPLPENMYGVPMWHRWRWNRKTIEWNPHRRALQPYRKAAGWGIMAAGERDRISRVGEPIVDRERYRSTYLHIAARIPFDGSEPTVKLPPPTTTSPGGRTPNWSTQSDEIYLVDFPEKGIYDVSATVYRGEDHSVISRKMYANEALQILLEAIARQVSVYEQRSQAGVYLYSDD